VLLLFFWLDTYFFVSGYGGEKYIYVLLGNPYAFGNMLWQIDCEYVYECAVCPSPKIITEQTFGGAPC
jgi:hypothetical protein